MGWSAWTPESFCVFGGFPLLEQAASATLATSRDNRIVIMAHLVIIARALPPPGSPVKGQPLFPRPARLQWRDAAASQG